MQTFYKYMLLKCYIFLAALTICSVQANLKEAKIQYIRNCAACGSMKGEPAAQYVAYSYGIPCHRRACWSSPARCGCYPGYSFDLPYNPSRDTGQYRRDKPFFVHNETGGDLYCAFYRRTGNHLKRIGVARIMNDGEIGRFWSPCRRRKRRRRQDCILLMSHDKDSLAATLNNTSITNKILRAGDQDNITVGKKGF